MAPGASRHRSNTSASTASSRPRPLSRASTTSINTPIDQPAHSYQHVFQSIIPRPEQIDHTDGHQFSYEDALFRSEQHSHHAQGSVEPRAPTQQTQSRAASVDTAYSCTHELSRPPPQQYQAYESKENQSLNDAAEDKTQNRAESQDAQRKPKVSSASQANDQELRRLIRENCHRDLKEVAGSVLAKERGPKAEKTKQIFAMIWYSQKLW